jgi:uncharacterized protein YecE (DUF72 family)
MMSKLLIGTASWVIPKNANAFPESGSHLERYSKVFNCVEINSSFYREHLKETYEKWAAVVPENFKFSVKLSRYFTQKQRLTDAGPHLRDILDGISGLGKKWGALLVQLPPSLDFDRKVSERFFDKLTNHTKNISVVIEPRHPSWGSDKAIKLLSKYSISKVLADPEPCKISREARSKVESVRYLRLHGSPMIYKTLYPNSIIKRIAKSISEPICPAQETWCIFDNTAYGYATMNALELQRILGCSITNTESADRSTSSDATL